jgi:HlyD family secretion protein
MMKNRNKVLLAAAALAAAGVVAWALRPLPPVVETARVARGDFERHVSDDGRTRVRDRYVITAPLAGRVERVTLRPGDRVARGDAVASLTPAAPAFLDARTRAELQQRVGASEAQLRRARAEASRLEAQLQQARADRERQSKLAGEGFLSPMAREQAELQVRVAERALDGAAFAVDAAGHDLAQARAALALTQAGNGSGGAFRIAAPVSGAVLKVMQESEAVVGLGAPLLEIAEPRSLEAVVDVLSQESVAIRPGMAARIELGPGTPALEARVRLVEPAAFTKVSALGVEEQRVNVILDFVTPPPPAATVGDGYRVEARIVVERAESALKVPVGALFRDGPGWAVFVVEAGRAVKRAVQAPARNDREARVASGLAEGERVVVYPPDALADGSRVAVR